MRKLKLYVVHPDRTVDLHDAKVRLSDYIDTRKGRWLLKQENIFDRKPVAEFESWEEFDNWTPEVMPPRKPSVLAIAGDVVPQSPVPTDDEELVKALMRTPVDAAQDLMTSVGAMDRKQTALTWAAAGVLGVCALAILVILMIAAVAWLGRGGEAPVPPELAPAMTPPVGTPWPWPTAVPPAAPVPASSPRRRRRPRARSPLRRKGALVVYDKSLPAQPYTVSMPRDVLRERLGEAPMRRGLSRMWVCRRDGDALEPLPIQQDERQTVTPDYLAVHRDFRRQVGKTRADLLIFDADQPKRPYMVTLPHHDLQSRFGGLHELKVGRRSMWMCRRNGDGLQPLPIDRDHRTTRTPEFLAEYMRLRPDKDVLARPQSKVERAVVLGAVVGVTITVVAGLILVTALTS